MRKISALFLTICLFLLLVAISSLYSLLNSSVNQNQDYAYMDEKGYNEYISDKENGEITSFCGTSPSIKDNKKAIEYYNENKRECNGFLITNYEDGICINQVLNSNSWDWTIPETLDGFPVVKIGCCRKKYNFENISYYDVEPFFIYDSTLSGDGTVENKWGEPVHLPKTIKYIDYQCLNEDFTHITYTVDKENPYYYSDENDNLYAIENGKKYLANIYVPYC